MAAYKVNGGIASTANKVRYFKVTGPFAWTVSDGTVNLPVITSGGDITATTYMTVSDNEPVPNSALQAVMDVILDKSTVTLIAFVGGDKGAGTTGADLIVERSGWLDVVALQEAIRLLPDVEVYVGVGGAVPDPTAAPVPATISFSGVTVTESLTFTLP